MKTCSYPGNLAPVCERKGNEFSCPTGDSNINGTCDTSRCPLQGPPIAPVIMEPQPTGWNSWCFGQGGEGRTHRKTSSLVKIAIGEKAYLSNKIAYLSIKIVFLNYKINSQSLEDTQVGTFCKNTLWINTLWKNTLWGNTLWQNKLKKSWNQVKKKLK